MKKNLSPLPFWRADFDIKLIVRGIGFLVFSFSPVRCQIDCIMSTSKWSTKSQQNRCQCLSITNDQLSARAEKFPFLPSFRQGHKFSQGWAVARLCCSRGHIWRLKKEGDKARDEKVSSRMGIPLPVSGSTLNKASLRGLL